MQDDPLMFAIRLTRSEVTSTGSYINSLLGLDDVLLNGVSKVKDRVRQSERSKYMVYKEMNPSLEVHEVYGKEIEAHIPEYMRVSFSRLRLSAHRLKIETGRWSRLPRDQRLCPCGQVQDEAHALQWCPLVQSIRDTHGHTSVVYPRCVIQAQQVRVPTH